MIDHGFYTKQYLGTLIPATAFPEAVNRAGDALERFRRIYRVTGSGEVAQNMALCAMAEAVYLHAKRGGGITSATVGNASVRYTDKPKSLDRQLLEKASIYLDICRGVD